MPDVFLDTDVAFDIISKREPYYSESVKLLQLSAQGLVQLSISENSLGNLFYLAYDIYKLKDASLRLSEFITACKLVSGGKKAVLDALNSAFRDKEDALQYYTAVNAKAEYFITRNIKDYKITGDPVEVYTPMEFMKTFDKTE